MCFAPQRRALVRHLNFQKWSDRGVICTFWHRNVLRATAACTFSTSQLPKVVQQWCVLCILTGNVLRATTACTFSTSPRPKVLRPWCALYILTWKCASRHNGVQFFISHLASWLRTRRFSEPTFGPSGAPNHWENTVFRDFPAFSRICIFFLLTLSLLLFFLLIFLFSLPLPCSAFHLSILSEVWLLNFLRSDSLGVLVMVGMLPFWTWLDSRISHAPRKLRESHILSDSLHRLVPHRTFLFQDKSFCALLQSVYVDIDDHGLLYNSRMLLPAACYLLPRWGHAVLVSSKDLSRCQGQAAPATTIWWRVSNSGSWTCN